MERTDPRRRRAQGFTLLELIVAMAILTILAGAAIPVYSRSMKRERTASTKAELVTLDASIRAYFEDTGVFPPTFDDLLTDEEGLDGWTGPYATPAISSGAPEDTGLATDAWGRDYEVTVVNASRLEIRSLGPDAEASTRDDLVQPVDVTPIRRAETLDELATLNAAIAAYNATHLPEFPLSSVSHAARVSSLEAGGYLPGGTSRYDDDGWGDAYVADPLGRSPVVAVTSIHLGVSDGEDDDDDEFDDDDDLGDSGRGRGRGPPDTPPGHGGEPRGRGPEDRGDDDDDEDDDDDDDAEGGGRGRGGRSGRGRDD